MSKRVYGKKIRRSRNLYGKKKRPVQRVFEVIGMLVVVAGLALVGYAAGKPLMEFFQNGGGEIPSDTLEWTPPESGTDVDLSNTAVSEQVTETEPAPAESERQKAVFAPTSALDNASSLAAYLQLAKASGYNTVVLDLKDNSGNLWYKSKIPAVQDSDLIKGTLTAEEITAVFKDSGLTPTARISTLKDMLGPKTVDDMTYRFADGSYNWIDASLENGGKPWANPYLDGTKSYISGITEEMANAGFSDIILANLIYPSFSSYDISVLPSQVTDINTRHAGLTELVKQCSDKKGQSRLILEVSLKDVVENYAGYKNTAEALRGKNNLVVDGILISFNRSETGSELITGESSSIKLPTDLNELANLLFKQAARNLSGMNIIPCIDDSGLSDAETGQLAKTLEALGYESYMVK